MSEPRKLESNIDPEVWSILPESLQQFLTNGKTLIATDEDDWTVSIKTPPSYLRKALPAGSVLIAKNGCGDHLFLAPCEARPSVLDPKVYVWWHEGARIDVFAGAFKNLAHSSPPTITSRSPVLYHDGKTVVELGDEVTARCFFVRRVGRVVYVPGISKKNRDMEHHGLGWVCITFVNGSRIGTVVDPKTSCLQKHVRFLRRSTKPFRKIGSNEPFENPK